MTVRDTFRYTPSYSNVGGFLVWEHSDLDTHPLTIPDKQPDSYLIYTCQHTVQVENAHRVSRSDKGNQRIRHETTGKCQTERTVETRLG